MACFQADMLAEDWLFGMIQKQLQHIETTGQEVLGILRFETITTGADGNLMVKGNCTGKHQKHCICQYLRHIN